MDHRYVDYYFGPRASEAVPSGQSWHAASGVNAFVGVLAQFPLGSRWTLNAYARYTQIDGHVTNSPLVNKSSRSTAMLAAAYRF